MVRLQKESELVQPDQINALKEDMVDVACRHEFGGRKDQSRRMWRAQDFKLGKTLEALLSGRDLV